MKNNKDITIHSVPYKVNTGFKLILWMLGKFIRWQRIDATISDNTYQYTEGEDLK